MAKKQAKKTAKQLYGQKELTAALVITLLLGLGGGYVLSEATNSSKETMNSSEMAKTSHPHSMFMVDAEEAPKVELLVEEDAKSGYNVKLITKNFTFSPDSVNQENVVGEGHAHLYVDDEKVARLYGPYFHYDGSFEGTKSFRATLNANDHSEYAVDGEVIDTEVQVTHNAADPTHDETHADK